MERVRALFTGYYLTYENDGYKTVAVEAPVEETLLDPSTGQPVLRANKQPQKYGGIIDTILEKGGKLYVCDHKTASQRSIGDMYWEKLKTDGQVSRYMLLMYQKGIPIESFMYDVIVKPETSPKDVTKKAKEEIERDGSYCGMPIREPIYNGEEKEPPKLYGLRLLRDILDNPTKFFIRRPVYRDNETLLRYLESMARINEDMRDCKEGTLPVYENYGACTNYNRLCQYHSICSGDNPERMGYQAKQSHDSGLSDGCTSHSREQEFLSCRKKWWFNHVEKIAPVKREYDSSLEMGSLLHKVLELFLNDPARQSKVKVKLKD